MGLQPARARLFSNAQYVERLGIILGKVIPLTTAQKRRSRLFNQGCDDGYENRPANHELYWNEEAYFRGYNAGLTLREADVADDDPWAHNLDIELEEVNDESEQP